MDGFWRWLSKRDARIASAAASLLCLAVAARVALRRPCPEAPADDGRATPAAEVSPAPAAHPVWNGSLLALAPAAPNPFNADLLDAMAAKAARERAERLKGKRVEPAPKREAPKCEKAPVPAELLYRGIFVRTDGREQALIEDVTAGRTGFFDVDEDVGVGRIVEISRGRVVLNMKDGTTQELPVGERRRFGEGAK